VFLEQAIDAVYTPVALDPIGHVMALDSGTLRLVGTH
jgi:hypothetical protein